MTYEFRKEQDFVAEFMARMGQDRSVRLNISDLLFRMKLVKEEFIELEDLCSDIEELWNSQGVMLREDKVALIKELADLLYVIYGFGETFGIDLHEAFKRVHESNMSKLDDNGFPIKDESGKVLKSNNYKLPYLSDL